MANFPPKTRIALGTLFLVACLGVTAAVIFGPSRDERERWMQRKKVMERVRSIGGWDVLRRDCNSLAERCRGETSRWSADFPAGLPPAIVALKPRFVEFYPPKYPGFNDSDYPVVRITIFGMHSTGGHDIPRLGLDVICSGSGADYEKMPSSYWSYRKVADDVFEFF